MNVYQKFELTQDNHLKYYFNNNENMLWRNNYLDIANMSFGGNYIEKSFIESLVDTAKKITSNYKSKFYLFLSGGLDSEIACRIFILSKIEFVPIIIKFKNDLNIEDVYDAINVCKSLGIDYKIIDFDPVRFFHDGEWKRIAKDYQVYTFYQQLLMYITEKLSSPMLTVDEIELVRLPTDNWGFIKKEDQDGSWHRFVDKTGIPAHNNFYTFDISTISAFMKYSPTVHKLINNEIFGKLSWASSKHLIYNELTNWNFFRRKKRTGMEKLMHIWLTVENGSLNVISQSPKTFQFDIAQLTDKIEKKEKLTCSII